MAVNPEASMTDGPQPMGGPESAEGTMSASTLEGSPQPAAPEAPAAEAPSAPAEPTPMAGAQPAADGVTGMSSESSEQTLSLDTGTGYGLSDQGSAITTGGEPGGYAQSVGSSGNTMSGDVQGDALFNGQSASSDTDYADGGSMSTDSSSFTGALDVGAMFQGAASNAGMSSGEDGSGASSDSASMLGGLEAAALVTGGTSSTDVENADGSSSSSDSATLSTALGLDGVLGGAASSSDSNGEGDSSSESGSMLGTLDSVAGLTIEGTQNSSESADGEAANSSELTIDLDTFLEGNGESEYHAAETGSDGSSSGYDQVSTGGFDVQNDLGGSQSDSSYEDDAALVSLDLSGDGPLLGFDSDPDALLAVDSGLESFDHGGFG